MSEADLQDLGNCGGRQGKTGMRAGCAAGLSHYAVPMVRALLGTVGRAVLIGATLTALAPLGSAQTVGGAGFTTVRYNGPVGGPGPVPNVEEVVHEGRDPSQAEQDVIDDALELIEQWEDACESHQPPTPPGGQQPPAGLPELPKPQGGGTETVSKALGGISIGVETAPGATGHAGASSPGSGSYPTSGGDTLVVDGDGISVGEEQIAEGAAALAGVLIHEAAHLAFGGPYPGTAWQYHDQVLPWLANYFCVLAECADEEKFPGWEAAVWAAMYAHKLTIGDACEYCGVSIDPCPTTLHWVNFLVNQGHVEMAKQLVHFQWPQNSPDPAVNETKREPISYASTLSTPGTGEIFLTPDDNVLRINWAPNASAVDRLAGTAPAFALEIDFDIELPNFQATTFALPARGDARQFAIGGYHKTTGDGWLLRMQLDFATAPCYLLTTEYVGAGPGIPTDIAIDAASPSRVVVLDAASVQVSLVNIISDTVTVLQTGAQTEQLGQCRYLALVRTRTDDSSSQNGVAIIASSDHRCTAFLSPTSSFAQTEVRLIDYDADGVIDGVIVG